MHFIGDVVTKWLHTPGSDRKMKLMQDFTFIDSKGTTWTAPAGHEIDGASIPQFLWSTVGSPFTGDYRRASVLHDYECDRKIHPHKVVHRLFYDAMICDEVNPIRAKYMYQAVRLFGPKWGGVFSRAIHTASVGYESALLNQNLDVDIDELDRRLDATLGE
jgi:hypothetical protein